MAISLVDTIKKMWNSTPALQKPIRIPLPSETSLRWVNDTFIGTLKQWRQDVVLYVDTLRSRQYRKMRDLQSPSISYKERISSLFLLCFYLYYDYEEMKSRIPIAEVLERFETKGFPGSLNIRSQKGGGSEYESEARFLLLSLQHDWQTYQLFVKTYADDANEQYRKTHTDQLFDDLSTITFETLFRNRVWMAVPEKTRRDKKFEFFGDPSDAEFNVSVYSYKPETREEKSLFEFDFNTLFSPNSENGGISQVLQTALMSSLYKYGHFMVRLNYSFLSLSSKQSMKSFKEDFKRWADLTRADPFNEKNVSGKSWLVTYDVERYLHGDEILKRVSVIVQAARQLNGQFLDQYHSLYIATDQFTKSKKEREALYLSYAKKAKEIQDKTFQLFPSSSSLWAPPDTKNKEDNSSMVYHWLLGYRRYLTDLVFRQESEQYNLLSSDKRLTELFPFVTNQKEQEIKEWKKQLNKTRIAGWVREAVILDSVPNLKTHAKRAERIYMEAIKQSVHDFFMHRFFFHWNDWFLRRYGKLETELGDLVESRKLNDELGHMFENWKQTLQMTNIDIEKKEVPNDPFEIVAVAQHQLVGFLLYGDEKEKKKQIPVDEEILAFTKQFQSKKQTTIANLKVLESFFPFKEEEDESKEFQTFTKQARTVDQLFSLSTEIQRELKEAKFLHSSEFLFSLTQAATKDPLMDITNGKWNQEKLKELTRRVEERLSTSSKQSFDEYFMLLQTELIENQKTGFKDSFMGQWLSYLVNDKKDIQQDTHLTFQALSSSSSSMDLKHSTKSSSSSSSTATTAAPAISLNGRLEQIDIRVRICSFLERRYQHQIQQQKRENDFTTFVFETMKLKCLIALFASDVFAVQ